MTSPSPHARPAVWATRLAAVPASFFGIVLGLAGLGTAWRAAHQLWGLPAAVGEILILLAALTWAALLALYAFKWIGNHAGAVAELSHPVQCCFVGLAGVATMLVAGGLLPYGRNVAEVVFALGAKDRRAAHRASDSSAAP